MFRLLGLVLLSVLVVTFTNCKHKGPAPAPAPAPNATGADLTPTSTNSTNTGCDEVGTNTNLQVQITVKNIGTADAPASVTQVTFTNVPTPSNLNTPAVPAGGSTKLQVLIPDTCGGANCAANITVNSDGAVPETPDAQNNNKTTCIARIG